LNRAKPDGFSFAFFFQKAKKCSPPAQKYFLAKAADFAPSCWTKIPRTL
jgi:hypothetical protein